MATIRGGDITQFKLKGRELDIIAEASIELILSGFDNTFVPTGNGKIHGTRKRVLAGIDGIDISIDNAKGDLEYIADIKNAGEQVAVNISIADGTAWTGSLGIEGELKYSASDGKASFTMRGIKLEQI